MAFHHVHPTSTHIDNDLKIAHAAMTTTRGPTSTSLPIVDQQA